MFFDVAIGRKIGFPVMHGNKKHDRKATRMRKRDMPASNFQPPAAISRKAGKIAALQ
ncbi:MAG: hypothetical protein ACTHL1_11650 [Burkholderiaceae bacterium]